MTSGTVALVAGNAAEWAAAIGTSAAVIVSALSVRAVRRDQRADKREGQARTVAAWLNPDTAPSSSPWEGAEGNWINLRNGSEEPVYSLVVAIVTVQGAGAPRRIEEWSRFGTTPHTTAAILPRGTWKVWISHKGVGAMGVRLSAEVAFTDRLGQHWVRRALGALEALPKPPLEHFQDFGIHGPFALVTPEPA